MNGLVTVRVVCFHRGESEAGPPAVVLERDVYPQGTDSPSRARLKRWAELNPDYDRNMPVPPDLAPDVMEIIREASRSLKDSGRGHWLDRRGVRIHRVRQVQEDGSYVQHQLRCGCGITERVAERDLIGLLRWIAANDSPDRRLAPLGGIERMLRLID